jgi:transcriptional regulator with XRE-family HTH domain
MKESIMGEPKRRRRMEDLSPEARARAEAKLAEWHSPEHRAREEAAREAIARDGGVSSLSGFHPARVPAEVDDTAYSLVAVGRAIRDRRDAAGRSLEDVARESGVDASAIAKIERGANPNPTVGTLSRITAALGVRIAISFETGDQEALSRLLRDFGTREATQLLEIASYVGYDVAMQRLLDAKLTIEVPADDTPTTAERSASSRSSRAG